jgi:hypothetical protein
MPKSTAVVFAPHKKNADVFPSFELVLSGQEWRESCRTARLGHNSQRPQGLAQNNSQENHQVISY